MKKKVFSKLLLLFSCFSFSQTQIGSDIDGKFAGDLSGSGVAISQDGSVVAIGSRFNNSTGTSSGHVRVFKNVSGVWVQVGADINGEAAGDQSGFHVSMSNDGSVIAIGAHLNDQNGTDSGHVRVYKNISGVWTKIGSDIDGEAAGDRSGYCTSLSDDGNILAIGSIYNAGAGIEAGHVRIFQNIANEWVQLGNDIDGDTTYDRFGWSVSLSSNGQTLVVGSPNSDSNGSDSGRVKVYRYISGSWNQIGFSIEGEAAFDQFGISVSISSDGASIAIGANGNDGNGSASGHVRIYKNINEVWTQIGSDIDGEATGDNFGKCVSLSADGNTVAIGGIFNTNGNGTKAGHTEIYSNISGVWTQIGIDIDGEAANDNSGRMLSLSADGKIIAIGAESNDGNGTNSGHVRVFDLTSIILPVNTFSKSTFDIYPNPCSDILNIVIDGNLNFSNVNIYNYLGQLIKSFRSKILNIQDIPSGSYLIEINTNEGNLIKKIIKN